MVHGQCAQQSNKLRSLPGKLKRVGKLTIFHAISVYVLLISCSQSKRYHYAYILHNSHAFVF